MSTLLADTIIEIAQRVQDARACLANETFTREQMETRLAKSEEENKKLRERMEAAYNQNSEQYKVMRKADEHISELERLNQGHRDAITYNREQITLHENFLRKYPGLTLEFKKYKALRTRPKK